MYIKIFLKLKIIILINKYFIIYNIKKIINKYFYKYIENI